MFRVTFTLLDAYGRTTRRSYDNNRSLMADVLTDSATMLGYLEALSGAAVEHYSIAQTVPIASPSPEALSNNDAGATLHCLMDNSKLVGLKIPAIDPAMVNSDGTVKIDDAAVIAFVGAFATDAHWRISEGNYIASVRSGELDK
jgi:hypothetical protein